MSKPRKTQAKPKKQEVEKAPIEETNIPMTDHVVTQEDLDNNPELVGKVEVGDVIQIVEAEEDESITEPSEETAVAPEEEAPVEDKKVEEPILPPPENAVVPDRPSWVDLIIWNNLSLERKECLIKGEDWR